MIGKRENMNEENYTIRKNEKFGRFMVANKDIKAGELILLENPLLIGPQINGPLICFNCCRSLRKLGFIFCKWCNAAVICSPKCTGTFHTQEECAVFKDIELDGKVLSGNDQVIFPLRCLILKKYKPEVWNSIMELEPHLESRRNSPIWNRHKEVVEQCLRDMNLASRDDLENELVQRICGLLDVNTFEIRPPQSHSPRITNPETQCLRGLYLKAALMAHDCVGNTHLSVDDDFVLRVKASVDIPKYSAILFNYANALHGSLDRKQHLREGKYFECNCNRCNDPTELNTELSSLKCHGCRKGLIRVIEPTAQNSDWRCTSCGKTFKHYLIDRTVTEGRRRVQEIDPADIKSMESLHRILLQTFHHNHYLVLELEQNMVGEYTHLPPNQDNLIRKIELCQHLVEIFPKIEPGISRIKAILFYQLQSSMIDLAHKQYRIKSIRIDELIVRLMEAEKILKEAIRCFLYEPPRSPEGRITVTALSEMKMLRLSIENIKNDLLTGTVANKRTVVETTKTGFSNDEDIGPFNMGILKDTASNSLSSEKSSNFKNHRSRKNKKKHL